MPGEQLAPEVLWKGRGLGVGFEWQNRVWDFRVLGFRFVGSGSWGLGLSDQGLIGVASGYDILPPCARNSAKNLKLSRCKVQSHKSSADDLGGEVPKP